MNERINETKWNFTSSSVDCTPSYWDAGVASTTDAKRRSANNTAIAHSRRLRQCTGEIKSLFNSWTRLASWKISYSNSKSQTLVDYRHRLMPLHCSPFADVWHSSLFMVALWNRETIYIFMLWFVLLSSFFLFFPRLISAAADWMSAILPHVVWP